MQALELSGARGNRDLLVVAIVLAFVLPAGAAAGPERADSVDTQMRRVACAFQAEDYAEARRLAERALAANPSDPRLALLAARTVLRQYEGVDEDSGHEEDRAKGARLARETIAAYAKVLALDAGSYEAALLTARLSARLRLPDRALAAASAYETAVPLDIVDMRQVSSLARLYQAAGARPRARELLLKHATSEAAPRTTRAEAYLSAAMLDWECANDILKAHATPGPRSGMPSVYRTNDPAVRRQARECARSAMEMLERSLVLHTIAEAWAYKKILFAMEPRLRQLEGRPPSAVLFETKAREADAMYRTLAAAERQRAMAETEGAGAEGRTSQGWPPRRDAEQVRASVVELVRTGALRRRGSADVMGLTEPGDMGPVLTVAPPPDEAIVEWRRQEARESEAERRQKRSVVRFSPDGGEFTVEMPSPVTPSGSSEVRTYSTTSESVSYAVASHTTPALSTGTSLDGSLGLGTLALAGLEGVMDTLEPFYEFEASFVRDTSAGGVSGTLYRFRASQFCGDTTGALLVYGSRGRAYMLLVRGADDRDPRVEAFFESFEPGSAPGGEGT
jgi:hypothetical protein